MAYTSKSLTNTLSPLLIKHNICQSCDPSTWDALIKECSTSNTCQHNTPMLFPSKTSFRTVGYNSCISCLRKHTPALRAEYSVNAVDDTKTFLSCRIDIVNDAIFCLTYKFDSYNSIESLIFLLSLGGSIRPHAMDNILRRHPTPGCWWRMITSGIDFPISFVYKFHSKGMPRGYRINCFKAIANAIARRLISQTCSSDLFACYCYIIGYLRYCDTVGPDVMSVVDTFI